MEINQELERAIGVLLWLIAQQAILQIKFYHQANTYKMQHGNGIQPYLSIGRQGLWKLNSLQASMNLFWCRMTPIKKYDIVETQAKNGSHCTFCAANHAVSSNKNCKFFILDYVKIKPPLA